MSEEVEQPQLCCQNCGTDIKRRSRFCVNCGVKLIAQARASDSKKDATISKNISEAESRAHNESVKESSDDAALGPSRIGRIQNLIRENKVITLILPALVILATAMGAINDFWGLIGMLSDEEASNARPYIGIEVKDYAPALSAFSYACSEEDEDCKQEAEKAERNEELKQRLRERGAVRVRNVATDSPAADAGVQIGDIVTGIDGYSVAGSAELSRIMEEYHPGDVVRLSLYRTDESDYLQQDSVQVELGA